MRQLFFAFLASLLLLAACGTPDGKSSDQTKSNDQSEKNLASARAVGKAFETGDANSIDTVVADDYLDHTDRGDKKGRDSLKASITMMHDHGKDMKMETLREVADNDYVFQWMRYTGTSDGSMGPAGPYDMRAIEVSRHKDGKIVEHWSYVDMAEMMKMMGQGQPPANPAHTDTMKGK